MFIEEKVIKFPKKITKRFWHLMKIVFTWFVEILPYFPQPVIEMDLKPQKLKRSISN